MNIFSRIYHRLFDGVPRILRIICRVTLGMFLFIGLCMGVKGLSNGNATDMITAFLIFGLLGLFCVCFTGALWQFLVSGSKRHLGQNLDELLSSRGFCQELAESAKNANMFPTVTEKLQQAFIMVMCEYYKDAESQLLPINLKELSNREAAMYHTCRLQIYVMTGAYEKQIKLFEEQKAFLDSAYERKPNLTDRYVQYADDALAYYMLAGALMMHRKHPEQAKRYEKLAAFQLSNRSEPETKILPQIIKLNNLFADQKMQPAHELENKLKGEIANSVMPEGTKLNLLRWIDQARIYSTLPIDKTEYLADRRLPEQGVQAQKPEMEIPDLF